MTQQRLKRALGLDREDRERRKKAAGLLAVAVVSALLMGWAGWVTGYNQARKDAGLWKPDPSFYCDHCLARRTTTARDL